MDPLKWNQAMRSAWPRDRAARNINLDVLLATRRGDSDTVVSLLASGVDPDSLGTYGETALHYVALLLDHGASMFVRTREQVRLSDYDFIVNDMPKGTTPVEWAILEDNSLLLQLFMQRSPRERTFTSLRAYLNLAARSGSTKCLGFLLERFGGHSEVTKVLTSFDGAGLCMGTTDFGTCEGNSILLSIWTCRFH